MAFHWKSTEQYNILPNMLMVPKKMANCDKIAFVSTCLLYYWMTINEASSYVVLACVFKTPLTYYENEALPCACALTESGHMQCKNELY